MPPDASTPDGAAHHSSDGERTSLRYWAPAIAVSLTTFIIVVNASLMNVAIPTMVAEFDTSVTVIQHLSRWSLRPQGARGSDAQSEARRE